MDQETNSKAIKSGSGYVLANILLRATAIISAPIFTRLLTPEDYGIASNFLAWSSIVSVVAGLGLVYTIGNATIDFNAEINRYIASLLVLVGLFSIVLSVLGLYFIDSVAEIMSLNRELVIILLVYIILSPSVLFTQEKYKYDLSYKNNIRISVLNVILSIIFSWVLIMFFFNDKRYLGRVTGLSMPFILFGLYFYLTKIRDFRLKEAVKFWKYALRISLPMIPHSLAMLVLTQMDRLMIIKFSGNSDGGLYSFGMSYAVLMLFVSNAVLQAFNPWLYVNYQQRNNRSIGKVHNTMTVGLSLITIVSVSVGPEILYFLGTSDYLDAIWIITPVALASLFQYLYNTYSSLELYHKRSKAIAIGTVFTASINFVLNYLFIPKFGYHAAAYTTLISYITLALYHLIVYRRICKGAVFNDRYIWLVVFVSVLISVLMTINYQNILTRYLLLLMVVLSVLFWKRTDIERLISYVKNKL